MGRRLAGYVPIHDGDQTVWYGPDDKIPADVAKKIGDHAWIDDADEEQSSEEEPTQEEAGDAIPKPPPQAGKGSGVKAWAAYAEVLEVEIADDASREDIVDAIRDAGHPVD